MPSRRRFLAALLAASAFMVEAAAAQGNGNGNGNGGKGGGNGNGAGNGGGSSNAGSGNSNAGGNGKGKENAGGTGTAATPAPASAIARSSAPPTMRVRHSNGFEEEIEGGRYEMRDNQGRQIVNRAVRTSDYARLRRLMQ